MHHRKNAARHPAIFYSEIFKWLLLGQRASILATIIWRDVASFSFFFLQPRFALVCHHLLKTDLHAVQKSIGGAVLQVSDLSQLVSSLLEQKWQRRIATGVDAVAEADARAKGLASSFLVFLLHLRWRLLGWSGTMWHTARVTHSKETAFWGQRPLMGNNWHDRWRLIERNLTGGIQYSLDKSLFEHKLFSYSSSLSLCFLLPLSVHWGPELSSLSESG